MEPWILRTGWSSRLTLILRLACLYCGVVLINQFLFSWAEDTSYRYWFYPPAGIRLSLIMLFGLPGMAGYFLAVVVLNYSNVVPEVTSFLGALILSIARAGSIWAALVIYGGATGVKFPWQN